MKINFYVKNNKYLFCAIAAPMAVLSAVFLLLGVYPFGSNNIINSDLYAQFLPIMMELKRAVSSGDSIFYTFNGGLGTNFYSINAYQNASPLTWLFLALFSESKMTLCATLLFMVKTGLASGAMYYYLSSKSKVLHSESDMANQSDAACQLPLVALSAVYSLCGYVTAFYFNLMWLECVILLPLIVLGMRRAAERRGYKLYIISMALMLFSSYYIGLMVYFFLFVYCIIYLISERKENPIRTFIRIRLLTLFAVALAMVVLLPTYYALTKTGNYETVGNNSQSLFYYSIPVLLLQLLPGSKVTILNGPPNIYSGLVTLLLCVAYMMNSKIDLRRRIIKTTFLVFILFCTNFIPIDVLWQLGHPPNGFPCRYSFVLTFMAIEIAAESAWQLRSLGKRKTVFSIIGIIFLYAVTLACSPSSDIDKRFVFVLGAALVILCSFALVVRNDKSPGAGSLLIAAVMLFELITGTAYSMGTGGIVSSNRYLYHYDEVQELIDKATADNPHARMEVLGTDNFNSPFLYGYKGASIFASSVPSDTYRLLNSFWDDPNGSSRNFTYTRPNPISDSIANIDYYISLDKKLDIPWASEIASTDNCYLYKSNYPTSIGYMVPAEMQNLGLSGTNSDFLNEFVSLTSGADNVVSRNAIDLDKWDQVYPSIYGELLEVDEMKGNRLKGTIDAGEDGIFMTSIPYDDGWTVSVDGTEIKDANSIKYLISFPLEKGSHFIEMVYVPPKLKISAIISLSSLLMLICATIIGSWRTKYENR